MSRLRGAADEDGASSVELIVFFPLLLLIILVTVQVALSWYGNEVAMTAARETARSVREGTQDSASLAQAEIDGARYAQRVGGAALTDVQVDVVVMGDHVHVEVSGRSMDVVAGLSPRVDATVTSSIETFRGDT